MTLTKEEYLELVIKLVDQQYGNKIDTVYEDKIPSKPDSNSIIDVTSYKKPDIIAALLRCSNLKIGNFIIKIDSYSYKEDGYSMKYDLRIFEESPHIYLNRPCKKTTKLVPANDSRLDSRPWAVYFSQGSFAVSVPQDSLLDIIRWLQAMGKIAAFI